MWEEGNGSVACHFHANLVLKPTLKIMEDKTLSVMLQENPFTEQDSIRNYYTKSLKEYLDDEFEEYCTCDDYYQPVVEDFELDYYIGQWSLKNGFEVVSCEGQGCDDGYEPRFRRGWY